MMNNKIKITIGIGIILFLLFSILTIIQDINPGYYNEIVEVNDITLYSNFISLHTNSTISEQIKLYEHDCSLPLMIILSTNNYTLQYLYLKLVWRFNGFDNDIFRLWEIEKL